MNVAIETSSPRWKFLLSHLFQPGVFVCIHVWKMGREKQVLLAAASRTNSYHFFSHENYKRIGLKQKQTQNPSKSISFSISFLILRLKNNYPKTSFRKLITSYIKSLILPKILIISLSESLLNGANRSLCANYRGGLLF